MQTTMLTDKELINSYLSGDEKCFQELLNRYEDKIFTSIYMFVKNTELAEDIFQEVFIKIINTLRAGKYNHEGKFGPWARSEEHTSELQSRGHLVCRLL